MARNYGVKRRVGTGGYIYLWKPGHPLAHRDGYVAEHRFDNALQRARMKLRAAA